MTTCGDYLVGNLENSDTILVWDKSFKLIHKWHSEFKISDIVGLKKEYILYGSYQNIYVMDLITGKSKIVGEHGGNTTCLALFDDTLLSGKNFFFF